MHCNTDRLWKNWFSVKHPLICQIILYIHPPGCSLSPFDQLNQYEYGLEQELSIRSLILKYSRTQIHPGKPYIKGVNVPSFYRIHILKLNIQYTDLRGWTFNGWVREEGYIHINKLTVFSQEE